MNERKEQRSLVFQVLIFVVLVVVAFWLYTALKDKGSDVVELPVQELEDAVDQAQDGQQGGTEDAPTYAKAPDFTVYTADGTEVKLSDYAGKPVVLNFWASWCGPCKKEMPEFQAQHEKLGDRVVFLFINATDGKRETVEKGMAYIESEGYTFDVVFDTNYNAGAAYAYGVTALPTTYFINADGYAVARMVGTLDEESLQAGLDLILPEE